MVRSRAREANAVVQKSLRFLEVHRAGVHAQLAHAVVGDDEERRPELDGEGLEKGRGFGAVGVDGDKDDAVGVAGERRLREHLLLHRQTGVAPRRPGIDEDDLARGTRGGDGAGEVVLHEVRTPCHRRKTVLFHPS